MINKDFYPTPRTLISKMINGIDFSLIYNVLEPSAGKGDICDYLKIQKERLKFDVIEIEPELQMILKGKNYNLVYNDFLSFNSFKKYDLIIANFPFSEGDEHLNKALSIIENYGGALICLVNAETIKNPYTNLRKLVVNKLEKNNATIEYLDGEFSNAERKTNIEVALIKVIIEKENDNSLLLDNLIEQEQINIKEDEQNSLIDNNPIKQLITHFNFECKVGTNLIQEYFKLKPYFNRDLKSEYNSPIIELKIGNASSHDGDYINEFLCRLRGKYWRALLDNENFSNKYTSNILKEIREKMTELENLDFCLFNIEQLEKELNKKILSGIEKSIIDLFDTLSNKFSYHNDFGDNVHYFNGWKTNKSYKINKKVILPINGFSSYSWGSDKLEERYLREKLDDMVKVFNYLSKEKVGNTLLLIEGKIRNANSDLNFKNINLNYFDITFYKKGTAHIVFKDDELLEKFNIYGSQRKGWLPPSYGKNTYQEMTTEEKEIINEFQGKDSYNKVMNNKDYYIVENNQLLLN